MSVTIYEVAKAAGVSTATVSRVINEVPGVKTLTKTKVLHAIEELQYQYNPAAVALATGKSKVIGLMVPNLKNPFYTEVAEGVYQEALNRGLNVITLNLLEHQYDDAGLRHLSQYSVDGLLAMDISKDLLGRVSKIVDNVVLIGNDCLEGKTNCVVIDNFAGVQMMMKQLFQAGHRRVALLSEQPVYNDIKDRIRSYQFCMEEEGLSEVRRVVYSKSSSIEDGEKIGRKWIKEGLDYTAILVTNDTLAIGLMKALKTAGLNIPEDISVAGFDGTWVSSIVTPALSSVVQPMFEMGSAAISLIMESMQSLVALPRKIVLSPSLQAGGTISSINTKNERSVTVNL
jgi:LacI family transcriptional regulator